jgi:hypothetical protein
MTNEVATATTTALAPALDQEALNRLRVFGASTATRIIEGREIRFVDGTWVLKAEDEEEDTEIEHDTQLIGRCDLLSWCWTKWVAQRPVDRRFGTVATANAPARDELGDLDKTNWETDPRTGTPRDPWTFSMLLPLQDGAEKYVYTTQSNGGVKALGSLSNAFVSHAFDHGMEFPLIELRAGEYFNKKYNRNVSTPQLDIVRWVGANSIAAKRGDMDDEIPF